MPLNNLLEILFMITFTNGRYRSPERRISLISRLMPSFIFYFHLIWIVIKASRSAQKGEYTYNVWLGSSHDVLEELESVGLTVDVTGIDNVRKVDGPVVFICNHMSMMETLILPVMIQRFMNVTYVIKESLLEYPVFKHVMRSRDPIAVTRVNPRQDLKTVMSEGVVRLKDKISIIVFPQTTRATSFDASQMSSIGVKLAKKAGVTIIPVALKTDAWQNGTILKDFGRINPAQTVYFAFGKPMKIEGKGDEEQQQVNAFITEQLSKWCAKN